MPATPSPPSHTPPLQTGGRYGRHMMRVLEHVNTFPSFSATPSSTVTATNTASTSMTASGTPSNSPSSSITPSITPSASVTASQTPSGTETQQGVRGVAWAVV